MKKKERKVLEAKLLIAIKKVIKNNKADLTDRTEKAIKQALEKIAKKINKEKESVPQ